jgi:hypothetical protein
MLEHALGRLQNASPARLLERTGDTLIFTPYLSPYPANIVNPGDQDGDAHPAQMYLF